MSRPIDPQAFVPLVGYESFYEINSFGAIRRIGKACGARVGHTLKPQLHTSRGYLIIRLCAGGVCHSYDVHTLVARTFIGPRPLGMEVCHHDGSRTNPCLSNLRYDTPTGNNADKQRHGTVNRGEKNGQAKYDVTRIQELKRIIGRGLSTAEIVAMTGMPRQTINNIRTGARWGWL